MTVTRFAVSQWNLVELDDNGIAMAGIIMYVDRARSHFGLLDHEIAEDIEKQWPGLIPSGAAVKTDRSGTVWVSGKLSKS